MHGLGRCGSTHLVLLHFKFSMKVFFRETKLSLERKKNSGQKVTDCRELPKFGCC